VRDLTGADLARLPPSHPLARDLRRGRGIDPDAAWEGILRSGRPVVLHAAADPRTGRALAEAMQGRGADPAGRALAAAVLRETLGAGRGSAPPSADRPTRRPRPERTTTRMNRSAGPATLTPRGARPSRRAATASAPQSAPAVSVTPLEDFDTLRPGPSAWAAEAWGNPADVWLAPDGAGGQALRVDMQPGTGGRVALRYLPPASTGRRIDLSGAAALVLDLYNGHTDPLDVSLVLTTYDDAHGWRDFESRPLTLRPGWNRMVRFGLHGADFRSRETGWRNFDSRLANPDLCGKLGLFLYNGSIRETAPVLIDNMGLQR
jgi:hypothetical protein